MSVGDRELKRLRAQARTWHVRVQCCQGNQLAWVSAPKSHISGPSSALGESGWLVTLIWLVCPSPALPLPQYLGVCMRNCCTFEVTPCSGET